MKKILIPVFILTFAIRVFGQITATFSYCEGNINADILSCVTETRDGGFILCGKSFDGTGNTQVRIAKFNYFKSLQWQQQVVIGSYFQNVNQIINTSNGDYLLIGTTNFAFSGFHGNDDVLIIKLSADGQIIWSKCFGGGASDNGVCIEEMSNGKYIVGAISVSTTGDLPGNYGNSDFWVFTIDDDGNILDNHIYGGSGIDFISDIEIMNNGHIVILGSSQSYNQDVSGNHGSSDYWLLVIDENFNIVWQRCYGGSQQEIASQLVISGNNYYMGGYTQSDDGDVSAFYGEYDFWIVKTDGSGNIIWEKNLGGSNTDNLFSMQKDQEGNVIAVGQTFSSDHDVVGYNGNSDGLAIKISPDGDIIWSRALGSLGSEYFINMTRIASGEYILGGYTESASVCINSPFSGGGDMWVLFMNDFNFKATVFWDVNKNGIKESNEPVLNGQLFKLQPTDRLRVSSFGGVVMYNLSAGSYNLCYIPHDNWYVNGNSCPPFTITGSSTPVTITIPMVTDDNLCDNKVDVITQSVVVNSPSVYFIKYRNLGNIITEGQITLEYNPALTYQYSSRPPVSHSGNVLTWNYQDLFPFHDSLIQVAFTGPGVSYINQIFSAVATITTSVPDDHLYNNSDTTWARVLGSFDPNDKLCYPEGDPIGVLDEVQKLSYTVRFQNTGNYPATHVIIYDTLDPGLNPESIEIISSSHIMEWHLINNRVMRFIFSNIMLPDSSSDFYGSQGYVKYTADPYSWITEGDSILNTAYIFFDSNPEIITNTVVTTFDFYNPPQCDLLINTNIQHLSVINGSDGAVNLHITGGTPPYSYTINGSPCDSVIYGLSPGTYTLLVYNADTLCLPDTLTFTILQPYDPAGGPVLDTLHNLASECIPFSIEDYHIASVEMTSQGNVIVHWVFQGGGEEMTIEVMYPPVSEAGRYIVSITLNCNGIIQGTYMSYINISSVAMLAERNDINGSVNIYPNPVSDEMYVVCNRYVSESVLRIYTITGTMVKDIKVAPGTGLKVNTAELLPGLYFLQVISADGFSACNRFVKK